MLCCYSGLQKLGIAVARMNVSTRHKTLVDTVLATDPKAFFIGAGQSSSSIPVLSSFVRKLLCED